MTWRPGLVAALLIASMAGGATAQESGAPWLPLASGASWTYQVTRRTSSLGATLTEEYQVRAEVVEEGPEGTWRVRWTGEGPAKTILLSSTSTGLEVKGGLSAAAFIDVDVDAGTVGDGGAVPGLRTVTGEVGDEVEVCVNGESYKARPVTLKTTAPATTTTKTVWYARGVGPIKMELRVEAPASEVTTTSVMTSWEAGS